MRKITVDDIMALRPCGEYPRERVEWLLGGRDYLSLIDILGLDIDSGDRIWSTLRLIPVDLAVEFAEDCSLRAASYDARCASDEAAHCARYTARAADAADAREKELARQIEKLKEIVTK